MLDEADQMLERGFAESVEEILASSFSESKGEQRCAQQQLVQGTDELFCDQWFVCSYSMPAWPPGGMACGMEYSCSCYWVPYQ